jgi:5'(3')-deoxyribonucleotidase
VNKLLDKNTKPILAVDLDDTCADYASAFTATSNRLFATEFSASDYREDWQKLWGVDKDECLRRMDRIGQENYVQELEVISGAASALAALKRTYDLRLVTARPESMAAKTAGWVENHLPDMFTNIHHITRRNLVAEGEGGAQVTKGEFCRRLGAVALIDDQLKHCISAASFTINPGGEVSLPGLQALLFGNYEWNSGDVGLPGSVVRVSGWAAVASHFGVESSDLL